jgi:excisionase family DNA binding protein
MHQAHDDRDRDRQTATAETVPGSDESTRLDPRAFGLIKAAYTVRETASLLSIGRSSLYAVVKRGDLRPIKVGRRTLSLAGDLAAFLGKLRAVM